MVTVMCVFDTRWGGLFAVRGKDVVVYSELTHTPVRGLLSFVQWTMLKDMATSRYALMVIDL